MNRNVNIVTDLDGRKIVLIHDVRFKGKKREDWEAVEQYLKEYVGEFYEIAETSEKIFISSSFKCLILINGTEVSSRRNTEIVFAKQDSFVVSVLWRS